MINVLKVFVGERALEAHLSIIYGRDVLFSQHRLKNARSREVENIVAGACADVRDDLLEQKAQVGVVSLARDEVVAELPTPVAQIELGAIDVDGLAERPRQ